MSQASYEDSKQLNCGKVLVEKLLGLDYCPVAHLSDIEHMGKIMEWYEVIVDA